LNRHDRVNEGFRLLHALKQVTDTGHMRSKTVG